MYFAALLMSAPPVYSGKLGFEDVDLVEEEDDGRPQEPARVDDGFEEDEGLLHPVLETENGGRKEEEVDERDTAKEAHGIGGGRLDGVYGYVSTVQL
jgi:hypothetical protein